MATFFSALFPGKAWEDWTLDVILTSIFFQTIGFIAYQFGYGNGWEDRDRKEPPKIE